MRKAAYWIVRKMVCPVLAICFLQTQFTGAPSPGQRPVPARNGSPAAGVTVEDVIKLVKAGISEDIIIQHIRKSSHGPIDLSTDQLIQLKTSR